MKFINMIMKKMTCGPRKSPKISRYNVAKTFEMRPCGNNHHVVQYVAESVGMQPYGSTMSLGMLLSLVMV
jgi:hypothetical protein